MRVLTAALERPSDARFLGEVPRHRQQPCLGQIGGPAQVRLVQLVPVPTESIPKGGIIAHLSSSSKCAFLRLEIKRGVAAQPVKPKRALQRYGGAIRIEGSPDHLWCRLVFLACHIPLTSYPRALSNLRAASAPRLLLRRCSFTTPSLRHTYPTCWAVKGRPKALRQPAAFSWEAISV